MEIETECIRQLSHLNTIDFIPQQQGIMGLTLSPNGLVAPILTLYVVRDDSQLSDFLQQTSRDSGLEYVQQQISRSVIKLRGDQCHVVRRDY